jgi:uncharacterized membrane protein YsdA (DUF1294 family)
MPTAAVLIIIYLLLINCAGLYAAWSDKRKARQKQWRTPEKAFWLLALAGGGIGVLAGFYAFRHKTKHAALVFAVALCAGIGYTGFWFLSQLLLP